MGSEAFVASGDDEKAERVSRNGRPLAATIEAADATRRRETSALGKAIVSDKRQSQLFDTLRRHGRDDPGRAVLLQDVAAFLQLHGQAVGKLLDFQFAGVFLPAPGGDSRRGRDLHGHQLARFQQIRHFFAHVQQRACA